MKKRILCGLLLMAAVSGAQAQWLRVWQAGESTRYALSEATSIPYAAAGSTLTIGEDVYATAEIDSITIVNPVTITWNEAGASVDIPESVEGVTAKIDGGNVIITNVNTWSEQEFVLQGTSAAGSLIYNGEYKTKFHLNGVQLVSVDSAAFDIECGKRIDLILEDGTVNSFTDPATGNQKAAFYCRGHLEIGGSGSLTVTGNCKHALATKEYLFLKKSVGAITIAKSASDGIHCGEYFQMNGGTLVLTDIGGDGIQVESDTDSEEELNGQFIMNGGSINLTMTAPSTKGIRLDDDATTTTAATITPEMYINDGEITVIMQATALGAKAIASDGNFTIGTSTTSPTVAVTINADMDDEDERACGLKASNTLLIAGGNTTVDAVGDNSRGVRANKLRATGGLMKVTNTGDNSQGIKLDNVYVSEGGTVIGKFKY